MNHLQLILNTFGEPDKIVSDRGTAFTAKEFANFTNTRNIKHCKIAATAPWENSLVERINSILKSSLIKVATTPDGWKNKLGTIQYIINNTFHSVIKSSPSKLMLGYEGRNHDDLSFSQLAVELSNTQKTILRKQYVIKKDF